MIVVRLMGGLGNQMFQYAAGKTLADKYGVELFLDDTFLKADPQGAYTKRNFELSQFNTQNQIADNKTLQLVDTGSFFDRLFKRKGIVRTLEEGGNFNQQFFHAGSAVYLSGFWQSELYFILLREQLLKEFTPAYNLENESKGFLQKIADSNSVSVHVRRGDYISLKGAADFHGVPGMDYYQRAINFFTKKSNLFEFFLFSDDISWCRENFAWVPNITFVETWSKYSSTDMLLMKNCKHNIIANSSYSWWGAWLNENREKSVIAPKKWLQADVTTDTIYAKNWLRL